MTAREDTLHPYSVARMRSSMYLFAAGKLVSGLVGVTWLLTLVRVLDIGEYGSYVTLVALLEIVLLVSNAGVYSFAQRYVTEARLSHNLPYLPGMVWRSLIYRMATLLLFGAGLAVLAEPVAAWVRQPALIAVVPVYALVIVCEGSARYLELVFESLLEQGRAQFCAVLRNGLRLVAVGALWALSTDIDLAGVIRVEMATTSIGLLIAILTGVQALGTYRKAHDTSRPPAAFPLRRLASFALPMYLAQCLSQLYSPDAIKLIVSRMLGVVEAANFGFAHTLSLILQRYLPASLLIGLIRPMLVARRTDATNDADLISVANLILKINLLLLLPIAAFFAVSGRGFSALVSGGKYPDAGPLLFLLTFWLVLFGLHMVLSMLATAIEDRRAVLAGTIASLPGVVIGIQLAPMLGSMAMALGLCVSELLWCGFAFTLLRGAGFRIQIDWRAWVRLGVAGLAAAAAAELLTHLADGTGLSRLLLSISVIVVVYFLGCITLKPFSTPERAMIVRLLPARVKHWARVA